MNLVFLTKRWFNLPTAIDASSTVLPLHTYDNEMLCSDLGDGYSYLFISDGAGTTETVKVTCVSGVVNLERGANPKSFVAGSCVSFELVPEILEAFINENNSNNSSAKEYKFIDPLFSTPDDDDPSCINVTLGNPQETSEPIVFRVGNCEYTFENGTLTSSIIPGGPTEGVYENATITLDDKGQIKSITQGSNIVFNQNASCC